VESWRQVTGYYPKFSFYLAGIAVLLSIFQDQWGFMVLPIGIILLQVYQLGRLIDFPLSNFVEVFSIIILLYIVFGLLIGYLFDQITTWIKAKSADLTPIFYLILVMWITLSSENVIDKKNFQYVTWADQRAFEWIKNNVDESSLFLVNGFNIYDGTSSVGSDGGWWIPLLAERNNTMPPQYAMLNESPIKPGYSQDIVEIINTFSQTDPSTIEGRSAMCKWQISHIYIGQKQGLMNQVEPLLKWKSWQEVPFLDLIYAEDRVRIFTFDRSICQ
jgi:hypothetical protein